MLIAAMTVRLYAPWVHSLKEKRMEVKSLLARMKNQFHCSAAEVDAQDIHQTIVLGIACIVGNSAQADSLLDAVLKFMEKNTQAQVVQIDREIR